MIHPLEHGKNDLKTGACDHASRRQLVGHDQIRNISTRSIASILHTHPYAVDVLRVAWFVNMRKHLSCPLRPLNFKIQRKEMHLWVLEESMLSCIWV